VLRHFKNINLSPLLVDFDWLHVFLVNSLDGDLLARFLVSGKLDQAKLSLAEVVLKSVIVEKVCVADYESQSMEPFGLLLLAFEVENPRLIRWQHNFDWMKVAVF